MGNEVTYTWVWTGAQDLGGNGENCGPMGYVIILLSQGRPQEEGVGITRWMVRNRAGGKAAFQRTPDKNILFSFQSYGLGVNLGKENQE